MAKHVGRQVLGAGHRRGSGGNRLEIRVRRRAITSPGLISPRDSGESGPGVIFNAGDGGLADALSAAASGCAHNAATNRAAKSRQKPKAGVSGGGSSRPAGDG